jgi:FkbM family methyltransferase
MMSNKRIKQLLVPLICKKTLQNPWQKLYLLSVTGMNYGSANMMGLRSTGEQKTIAYIEQKTRSIETFVFFDVGANEGGYSRLLASSFKNRDIRIFAFEPSHISFANLRYQVQDSPVIRIFNIGFGERDEEANIYANYKGSGAASLYKEGFYNYRANENIVEAISLKTLDGFCSEQGIEKIDFLKIDVEGHELFVLQGGLNMLGSKKIRFIQFEFGPFHVYSKTFFKDFWDLLSPDYTIYRIVSNGLYEIKVYTENLEIFRTANFLAELK